jgi:two-component system KDP operon response regulator KdpE
MKILIIEDDENIVDSLNLVLHMRWPEAELISSRLGEEGLFLVETTCPDIVILDLGLPDINGFEILRQVRLFSEVPIIILTVLGDEDDIVKGLEMGANDYIVKPFRKMEFLARVKSLVRRQGALYGGDILQKGPYRLDILNHTLYYKDNKITLTKSESLIFYKLLINANRVVTYSSISQELWGEEYPGSVEAIRVYVQRLRQKIEETPSDHHKILETKINLGYVLNLSPKA